jgi:hypothetical protein
LASIKKIGLFSSPPVIKVAIPFLLSRLQVKDQKQYIIGLLSQLGSVPAIYDVVIPTLLEEFVQACVQDQQYGDFIMRNVVQATEAGLERQKEIAEESRWAEGIRTILLSTVTCYQDGKPLSTTTLNLLAYWIANIVRKLSSR